MSSAKRAVVQGMIGKVTIIGINALTGIIAARSLAPAGRGEQAAMILWPVLLSSATTLGLPSALSFNLKKFSQRRSELVSSALLLGFFISIVVVLLALILMPFLLAHYSASEVFFARCFLISIPVGNFMLIARAVLEADDNFGVSIVSQWLLPALTLVMLVALWTAHSLTPLTAAIAYTANGIPVAIWLLIKLRKSINTKIGGAFSSARQLLSYGLPAYGIDLCGTLSLNVDQALVVEFLEPKAMGIYAVALAISRMLNFCQASVTMVLLPKASGLSADRAVDLTARAARASMLVTGFVAAVALLLSPILIKLLYGNAFQGANAPLRLLLLEAVIGGTTMVLAQAAMALGRPKIITGLQLCGLAMTVPLMFYLLPRYGLLGAAAALLISTCLRMLLMLACFPLVLGYPAPRLWLTFRELRELGTLGIAMLRPAATRQGPVVLPS